MTPTASTAGTPSTPAATIGDAVIRIDNLHKDFGGKQVLRGVDLAIPPGTVLGLLGRNGSGKTTLIKCALGLFSTHITSDLERVANQVAILRDGQIGFHGELGDLKDRVKRLRITAREDLPASFAVPGALRTEVEGPVASVSVDRFSDRLVETLRTTWDADVTVQDLNLEEIFVEIHHA